MYCCTPKALYNHVGGLSSTTTSVQHPLGWCDGSHRTTAPVRSPHTSYRWRGERDRANQVDGDYWEAMIDKGLWREFGQDTGVTPLLFTRSAVEFLMTTESQELGLTSHPKDGAFLQYSVPITTGALGPTQTTGWAPPAGLTNTSSNSNLVFPGGLPSRYWPGSALLSFSGQPVLGCRVIWLWEELMRLITLKLEPRSWCWYECLLLFWRVR